MATEFSIPRQTDREVILALSRIQKFTEWRPAQRIEAHLPHATSAISISDEAPLVSEDIQYALELNSTVINQFTLKTEKQIALRLTRNLSEMWDRVSIKDEWIQEINDKDLKAEFYAKMVSASRSELKAHELEASLEHKGEDPWSRYRDAQVSILNSLEQTTQTLLVENAKQNAKLDEARTNRFERMEQELHAKIEAERSKLEADYALKQKEFESRTKILSDREAAFNTKEARYVARKKQEEQIDQLKEWLSDWKLTPGTTSKRRPIMVAYIVALITTGGFAIYAGYLNYLMLKSTGDPSNLKWWQWLAIGAKSFFPLAVFVSFMVYFIRWATSWAKQHSEEEFVNRTRLIDIGRSSWLLEAVRDAHERNKDIPPELIKELSRNLFSHTSSTDGDIQQQTGADMLMKGLSSLRIKATDGTEVEAKRGK